MPRRVQRNSQTGTSEDGECRRLHCPNSLPALTRHHPSPLQEDVDRNLPHQADASPCSGWCGCEEQEQSGLPVLLLLFFLSFTTLEQQAVFVGCRAEFAV